MERTDQTIPRPTPAALDEAASLSHAAGFRYALAAIDAEQAGDQRRANDLWQRADQNLTSAVTA